LISRPFAAGPLIRLLFFHFFRPKPAEAIKPLPRRTNVAGSGTGAAAADGDPNETTTSPLFMLLL
jgi:hypothetical protein